MAEEKIIRVVIIKRETIKPSSPTPAHLKTFKLSTLDQLAPPVYVPMLFFYPNNQATSSDQRSHNLKKSLSESLARFYPIAGTILNNSTIDCNDEGAQYIEARYNGLLSTFLEQPTDISVVQEFVPAAIESPLQATTWPLLLAQATLFDCGGLALGLSVSHKFADATTIGIFMKSWAATCAGSDNKAVVDAVLDGTSSFFPQIDLSGFQPPPVEIKKVESVTKRYVFDKPKIENLKAQITVAVDDDSQIHNRQPSRVEVVTAIIWKCVVAASRANSGPPKFALARSMNIRRRAEPPLPENLVGNFVAIIASRIDEHEPELQDLASELRRGLRDFGEKRAKGLRGDAALEVIFHGLKEFSEFTGKDDTEGLFVTSMCNFQLYETVEFGWGKPIWVTIPFVTGHNNVVTLTDSRDGGVEAWVTLSKQDMASFERDPEILQFSH
ncbi:stemmadenine O-acetyltransferase-like [Humulus lupulus]|uniref:stemmadenine O-acetyltransferase-like n=1 Tax=Humulus lupulus TaxID=3486 RepID=UPI002B40BC48|nr:stemmadenine O-acetyltransferase-like [Humulus lupulus]